MTTSYSQIFRDGLWDNNVAMGQMLGLCPLLAVTTSATNGLGMGIASLAVLLLTNTLISLIRGIVTPQVRIPVFIVLIASAVTLVDMAINAWLHELYKVLGLFIALIVTNCAIFGRAESFASKNAVLPAMADALAVSENRPQPYGTANHCVDGMTQAWPLADPETVDETRAALGLDPFDSDAVSGETCVVATTDSE